VTVVYDKYADGHHTEYLGYMMDYLMTQPVYQRTRVLFVVAAQTQVVFKDIDATIQIQYLPTTWTDSLPKNPNKSAIVEFNFLIDLSKKHNFNKLLLMHADAFAEALFQSKNTKINFTIEGILFLPYRKQDGSGMVFFFKGIRKSLIIRQMISNKALKKLYILNDHQTVNRYNEKYGKRFAYLPDPIDVDKSQVADVSIIKKKYNIDKARKILLMCGQLSARKNLFNIAKAIELLPETTRQQICLLICGQVEDGYEATAEGIIAKLQKQTMVVSYPRLFYKNEINEVFSVADIILVPYINFFNSSAMLGWAAKYQKPMIGSNVGVMCDNIEEYGLGVTVEPSNPKAIADAIEHTLTHNTFVLENNYCETHSGSAFGKCLLG
jgi:glycosyltransferase involved in cell wall biosynthesis